MGSLTEFRARKDSFFRSDPSSPLTPAQRAAFNGLTYFPEIRDLVITTRVEQHPDSTTLKMGTTDGAEQVYTRAALVHFEIEGQPAELTLFHAEGQHDLFVPFRDATSGKETYGAGRYLEVAPW